MLFRYFWQVRFLTYLSFFSTIIQGLSQKTDFPLNHLAYKYLDKYQTQTQSHFYTSFKPYTRHQTFNETFDDKVVDFNVQYLKTEGREFHNDTIGRTNRALLKKFYQYESDLYSYRDKSFDFHINPIWQFDIGKDTELDEILFTNSRGIELRGTIDNKISFYSFLTENQVNYPVYVKSVADSVGLIPYEGFWKEQSNGVTTDFFRAMGYIDFAITPHVNAQFGYGRHFIGSGERSLLLSDFSNSYPYVRISTEIWKFKYTNLFAKLIADVGTFSGGTLGASRYPDKYMVSHYLDLSITPKLNLGLFESIIFGKPDSLGGSEVKIEYLNPIIFYRAIEQQDGSSDNAILGADLRWTLNKYLNIYGQFVLDELIVSELFSSDNWWGNKLGYQIGGNYYDFIFPNLDLQIEYNWARPFTYTHEDVFTSYTHYLQPLAHPMGANFKEVLFITRWQPVPRLSTQFTLLSANYGVDDDPNTSLGKDPSKSYNLRADDYGHSLGQGIGVDLLFGQFITSYQLKHNFFLDGILTFRKEEFDSRIEDRNSILFNLGFRWNAPRRNYWF